ncbi:MAG TPA: DUF503 family protein, partial [Phycisphaerales bacterium]|nr:DUF503 family protein [Phycisphaerales bacterium]
MRHEGDRVRRHQGRRCHRMLQEHRGRTHARLSTRQTMIVGVMQVEIAIDWSQSLKDKRRVVKSLRDTLHHHHMVS